MVSVRPPLSGPDSASAVDSSDWIAASSLALASRSACSLSRASLSALSRSSSLLLLDSLVDEDLAESLSPSPLSGELWEERADEEAEGEEEADGDEEA